VSIDVHAHYVSPRVFTELRARPSSYGVVVPASDPPRVAFPGEPPPRPVLPALFNLDAHRAYMDSQQIDTLVLSPLLDLVGYSLPPEQGASLSRLINESLARDLEGASGTRRFLGLATVPMQDPHRAADELAFAVGELCLRGAMIDTNVQDRDLGDPKFDPFWEAAQNLGVPVFLHPFALAPVRRFNRYYLHNVVGYPFETTLAAAGLIFGGVLGRFPRLRVVLVHGGGFLPYQIGRFDRAFTARDEARMPGAGAPSQCLRAFFYDSLTHGPAALRFLVDVVGADRVLLGSDFPFGMGDPEPVRAIEEAGVDAETKEAICTTNAGRLLGDP
jgi:aminocarboxymuconate-semialdehyde decarboxylase